MEHQFKIISPDDRATSSPFKAVVELWREIRKYSDQIKTVFRQNFHASYQGTGMGILWNFILPIIPITVYLFLTQIRAFRSFEGVDGATYMTFGVMTWFVFAGFVQMPISTVMSRNASAMKTSLPLSASIVSSFANLVFDTFIRVLFVGGVMAWNQSMPTITAPLMFAIFIPGFLLFFGAGLILSILNVIYKDVSRVTAIILQYGIFVSGVIFPLGNSPAVQIFMKVNPFAVFVNASRDVVFKGGLSDPTPFIIWSVLGIFVFLVGCRMFYVMEYRIRGIL